MASALNLSDVAKRLIDADLVDCSSGIELSENWDQIGTRADYDAFLRIAITYLVSRPPFWLSSCFIRGAYHPEFIPTEDLKALSWMRDDLEPVLR